MRIQLKVTKDSPVSAYRHYDILRDEEKVGTFSKGADGRWNAQIIRDLDEPWGDFNRTAYAHSNYFAMVRLIACYLEGDMERVKYLQRGIWTNPCPVAEVI
jgi:hypothetical protein